MINELPLSYRWLKANCISKLIPWHFIEPEEGECAAKAFRTESGGVRDLICIAHRQDCDDFAGFEIIEGMITDKVICFHPAFNSKPNDHLIDGEYDDLWTFIREVVISDTRDWCNEEDIDALKNQSEKT